MSFNVLFVWSKPCKEPIEKAFISFSCSSNRSNIWINDKIFEFLIFKSLVGSTAIKVWQLFPESSQHTIESQIFLIIQEVLKVGSGNKDAFISSSILYRLKKWLILSKLHIEDVFCSKFITNGIFKF